MKKSAIMLLLLLVVGSFQGLFAGYKSSKDEIVITYSPIGTAPPYPNGSGKWQLILVDPDGKQYRDTTNGIIDMQFPPTTPLTFKVKGRIKTHGAYTLVVYACQRNDSIPVNLALLPGLITVNFGNMNPQMTIPIGYAWGNEASTTARDIAQIPIVACQRSFVKSK